MEMTIDEHMAQLKKLKSFHNGSYGASINFALDTMRKYQKMQADYEARSKADLKAMLEDLDLKIDEMYEPQFSKDGMDGFYWAQGLFKALVQEEINALKEAADDQSGAG